MSDSKCLWCKGPVTVFAVIRYEDLLGFCSPKCHNDHCEREKKLAEARAKVSPYTDFTSAESHVPRRR